MTTLCLADIAPELLKTPDSKDSFLHLHVKDGVLDLRPVSLQYLCTSKAGLVFVRGMKELQDACRIHSDFQIQLHLKALADAMRYWHIRALIFPRDLLQGVGGVVVGLWEYWGVGGDDLVFEVLSVA